ncbi:hypothetical protein AVEN_149693-1, partial [Araneus ventricosus]
MLMFLKFQEDDTQVWAINCQQRNEPLFSRKSHSGARNSLSPAFVEWGGLRRDRAHRVKGETYLPLTSSGRILLATWWLSVLVITTTYSANLIAFLAIPEVRFIVKSLQELADHKTVTLTIKEGCPILEELE